LLNFDHLWQGALTVVLFLFGWLIRDMKADIAKAEECARAADAEAEDVRKSLEAHKLFAAENYVRNAVFDRAMEAMEKRLAEKITSQAERQLAVMEEIRDRLPSRK
jgi:hypothetical protein